MADSLLTALCSICHVSPPQYRCPRCDVRTCSLGCVRKHKSWAACSGSRDATAYVPRSRLRTAAGVDHDYNFLHGIELAAERAERVLVGERGVVRAEELRPPTAQEVRWRTGRDGRRRKVLVTRVLRGAAGDKGPRVVERHLAARLARLNIEMACAPTGMTRQRENHTTLNRRTGRINWQVEWLSWGSGKGKGKGKEGGERALSKVMDDVPLCRAYHGMLEERGRAAQGHVARRAARPVAQSAADATWQPALEALQDPGSARWVVVQGAAAVDAWPEERDRAERGAFDFYLAGRAGVARLGPGESLRDVLANTRVLEFPTIYVLPKGEGLPAGIVLGPKDVVPARAGGQAGSNDNNNNNKREAGWSDKSGGRPAKRRRGETRDGEGVEGEGEGEDEEGGHEGHAVEEGDVIAEQDLMGEEEEEEEDDDDDTSSSGSDSDA